MPVAATPLMKPALQDLPRSAFSHDCMRDVLVVVGKAVVRDRRGMRVRRERESCIVGFVGVYMC